MDIKLILRKASDFIFFAKLLKSAASSPRVGREFEDVKPALQTSEDPAPESFKDSVMVSDEGKPILFYHGTRNDFEIFNKEFTDTSGTNIPTNYLGWYFTTSPDVAEIYVSKGFDPNLGRAKGGRINAYFLNVKNPYFITSKTYWRWGRGTPGEMEDLVMRFKSQGYDAIIMPSVWRGKGRGAFDIVVFGDNQIKRAS